MTDETATVALGYAMDQTQRRGYSTQDGVTITQTAAVADANNGNALALGYHSGTTPNAQRVRFGNLSGTAGDVVATASSLTIFEAHFFAGNIWTDHLSDATALMAALRTKYGVA